jgi:hypothetical protein
MYLISETTALGPDRAKSPNLCAASILRIPPRSTQSARCQVITLPADNTTVRIVFFSQSPLIISTLTAILNSWFSPFLFERWAVFDLNCRRYLLPPVCGQVEPHFTAIRMNPLRRRPGLTKTRPAYFLRHIDVKAPAGSADRRRKYYRSARSACPLCQSPE